VIDGTLGSPIVPAGAYALPMNLRLLGLASLPSLTVQEGAVFTSPVGASSLYVDQVQLTNACTATTPFTWAAGQAVNLFVINGGGLRRTVGATVPFVNITGGFHTLIAMLGTWQGSAAAPCFNVTGGGSSALAGSGAFIPNNAFTGPTPITLQLMDSSNILGATQPSTGLVVKQASLPANAYPALSLSAAGGAQALPTRPSTTIAPGPSYFLATPSGNQAATTTYTLQVAGAYQPLDIVRILFTKTQLNSVDVTVVDGGAAGVNQKIVNALVTASGSGYIDAQLNAAGTHWTLLGQGDG
jgi:hypothetical protein